MNHDQFIGHTRQRHTNTLYWLLGTAKLGWLVLVSSEQTHVFRPSRCVNSSSRTKIRLPGYPLSSRGTVEKLSRPILAETNPDASRRNREVSAARQTRALNTRHSDSRLASSGRRACVRAWGLTKNTLPLNQHYYDQSLRSSSLLSLTAMTRSAFPNDFYQKEIESKLIHFLCAGKATMTFSQVLQVLFRPQSYSALWLWDCYAISSDCTSELYT